MRHGAAVEGDSPNVGHRPSLGGDGYHGYPAFYGKIGKLGIVSIIGFAWLGIMDSVQHFIAVTTCWKAQKDAEKQHFTTFE